MVSRTEDLDPAVRSTLPARQLRADAVRNIDTLLETAKAVFATSGVDAPMRESRTSPTSGSQRAEPAKVPTMRSIVGKPVEGGCTSPSSSTCSRAA